MRKSPRPCFAISPARKISATPIVTRLIWWQRFFIATRGFPASGNADGYGLDGSVPLAPFEIALLEILADADAPALSEEQMQLLRQFDRLQEEAGKFRDLNALLDSGIIVRVRELKQLFDASFYHPSVLATIAPYNTAFGRRFDELFLKAATEIKTFARELEEQGGSILGNVDGMDVTVEHVSALQESELLRIDYGTALEKFRRVSRLRKTLQEHPPCGGCRPFLQATQRRRESLRPLALARSAGHAGGSDSATDFQRRRQAIQGRGIGSSLRARGRPQVPPCGSHALLQSDPHSRGSERLLCGRSRGEELCRRGNARVVAHGHGGRAHDHRTGRTEADTEFTVVVAAARRCAGGPVGD